MKLLVTRMGNRVWELKIDLGIFWATHKKINKTKKITSQNPPPVDICPRQKDTLFFGPKKRTKKTRVKNRKNRWYSLLFRH